MASFSRFRDVKGRALRLFPCKLIVIAVQDRFYIKRISGLPLKAVGVSKFEKVVFDAVKDKVREGILELIEKERKGEGVDRELLKSVVNVRFPTPCS